MAEENNPSGPSYPSHLTETGATLVGIFRQRLWEKEESDFKAGVIKQAKSRIMQAGQLAANSTVDDDPNGDAVANVPKEMIMTAYDVRMQAAQYPNNPLIAKVAGMYYNGTMDAVKELMGFDKQQAEVGKIGADTQAAQADADVKQADLAAGGPRAKVDLDKAQAEYYRARAKGKGEGGEKPQLHYGVPRGTIMPSASALFNQIRTWETLPAGQGGPDNTAWKQRVDARREEMASRRWGGMVGQKKEGLDPGATWTLKELAADIPYEDALNEVRYEEMLTAAPGMGVSQAEVQEKFKFLVMPGAAAAAMTGKPGRPLQDTTIAAMTIGKNKLSELEVSKGKRAMSVKDAIEVLPDNYKDMTSGDGLVNASLSEGLEFIKQEGNSDALAQLRSAPAATRKKEVVRILKQPAERQINNLFVEAQGLEDSEIPEATAKNREKARKIAYAAIEKYQEQILIDLGLITPPTAPKSEKTTLISGETVKSLGKVADDSIAGSLIRGANKFVFGKQEIK